MCNPVARDKLAALLWPDSEPAQARNNLRAVLSNIRKQLRDHIAATRRTIGL